jgi:uncharacterized membrane protein (DUF2068 family)
MIRQVQRQPAGAGVRGVAFIEATKGFVVLFAGFGLLSLVHHDLQTAAEVLIAHLHLNPAKHIARIFIEAASNFNDTRLRLLAVLALLYATIRLIEAYGLWFGQRWAKWLAVVSGGIYVPLEILELSHGFAWLKIFTLTANLAVVFYIGSVLALQNSPTRRIAE